jgi:hypothetical protein
MRIHQPSFFFPSPPPFPEVIVTVSLLTGTLPDLPTQKSTGARGSRYASLPALSSSYYLLNLAKLRPHHASSITKPDKKGVG